MKNLILLIILILLIVGIYFLLKQGSPGEKILEEGVMRPGIPGGKEVVEEKSPDVREVLVSGSEFKFEPSSIQVKEGELVRVVFANRGLTPHDLKIEGLGVGTKIIGVGEKDTFEFQAPTKGEYTFFCSVPGHRTSGMEGKLRVE